MATVNGTSGSDTLNGSNLDDIINGLAGNDILNGLDGNDILNGGGGADQMSGGNGNDTYYVDSLLDVVTEIATGGVDTVKSTISWTLSNSVETLILMGSSAINGTGNSLNNTLVGNSAGNSLYGLDGNDRLDGKGGADLLYGGLGNDTYVIDNVNDKVFESAGQGADQVSSSVSHTLGANVEGLTLTGAGLINGTGNVLANRITGNGAANTLAGLEGNDTLLGGAGNDHIVGGKNLDKVTGGVGNDVFQFASALDSWAWSDFSAKSTLNCDVITDFTVGDKIDLSGVDAISSPSGHNVLGDQAFVFIGQNNFHSHTGRELRYTVSGGDTYIYGSINGDTSADFCLKVNGVHSFVASDFVL